MTQEEAEAKTRLKEVWKDMVMNYSDALGVIGVEPVKKKLKLLNKIIDEMSLEEVLFAHRPLDFPVKFTDDTMINAL